MHFAEQLFCVLHILVMAFGGKDEPCRKGRVTEECTNAGDDVSEEEVEGLPTKMNLLAFELQASWHLCINDAVELPGIAIREAQAFNHLFPLSISC
jgi:hypothetical protein